VHRATVAIVLLVGIVAAGCSTDPGDPDVAGPCDVRPGVVCTDEDMRNVSMVAADLSGADFSGSDLRGSDLRDANLTGAKLVGALLGGVNFVGANLTNADLTDANLFFTNFADADLTGVNRTGVYACNVTQPNGALVEGDCPGTSDGFLPTPTGKPPTGPPVIESLELDPPGECLNDAAGVGIEVRYNTRNATSVTFAVDGIRLDGASKVRGVKRLPFICDNEPHTVVMQAYGTQPPTATRSLTVALEAGTPQQPVNG
jgi:hypothetical protein